MQTPIAPKIPPDLADWSDAVEQTVEIDRQLVAGADFGAASRLNIDIARLEQVMLTGAMLEGLSLTDAICAKLEGAALRAYKANLLRVELANCRFTGAEFAGAQLQDCVFKNVKFDEAGFRFAAFKRVRFENCMLRAADFSNAKFEHVVFAGCDITDAVFVSATCKDVDMTGEDLATAKGILGLKGSTISEAQLMQIAPLLADELGFKVAY